MPFTAPVIPDIGSGLANGILTGANALGKAIDFVSDQYRNQKSAQGAMQALSKMNGPDGNPIVSPQILDMFNKMSPQAQTTVAGLVSQKAAGAWSAQNQMLLQGSQGRVEQQTHAANTASDYGIARQYGVVPGRTPDQLPAGIGNRQNPQNGNGGGSNLVQPNNQQPNNQQPQQGTGSGLPSGVPMAPSVPTKTLNGKTYAVQHANPNDPSSAITHIFDSSSGKWIAVGAGGSGQ